MKVVFYGNRYGNLSDKIIRWWTSPLAEKINGKWKDSYSHSEIVFSDGMMFSASPYENVARFKPHSFTGKAWVRVDIDVTLEQEKKVRTWCEKQHGKKYDCMGVLGFAFNVPENPNKWFCSEVCTAALQEIGLLRNLVASKTSPNALHKELIK